MRKRKRKELLEAQHNRCACCGYHIKAEEGQDTIFDKIHNKLICRSCALFLNSWRKNSERGIQFKMFVEYEQQE